MPPTSETVSRQTLQGLGNIANLSPQAFEELATKIHIETQPAGRRLFIRGRRDNWIYFLLQGNVRLDYLDNRSEEIRSNTNEARQPLVKYISSASTPTCSRYCPRRFPPTATSLKSTPPTMRR